jgi:outer membrane protein OmpA-like peptidoglycan-associated protein
VRTAGGITLSGYVPSEEAHGEVRAAAAGAFPDAAITDTIRIAAGAPTMDWIGAIKFGLGQLSLLASGNVGITNRTYQIAGIATSVENYEAIGEALARTLPASLELGTAAVSPPLVSPYRFSAAETAEAITLDGYFPDSASHAALLESVAHKFRGLAVGDHVALAGGAPDGFTAMAEAGLQAISRLEDGRLEIVDTAVTVSGSAFAAGAVNAIRSALAAASPAAFTVAAEIGAVPPGPPATPAACQDLLRQELASGRIEFPTEESAILADSYGLLDRLVAILERCPEARVEIGGHTDSDGSESFNLSLSTARANAVLDYLVAAGVLRERLDAVGYGETRPIASNSTEEGKAENRRIELTVLED